MLAPTIFPTVNRIVSLPSWSYSISPEHLVQGLGAGFPLCAQVILLMSHVAASHMWCFPQSAMHAVVKHKLLTTETDLENDCLVKLVSLRWWGLIFSCDIGLCYMIISFKF